MSWDRTLAIVLLAVATSAAAQSPSEVYSDRVLPLIRSDGSSCSACHFQGIDLASLFHEDPIQTFAELRARDWIDTDKPRRSKLLEFLKRHRESETEIERRARLGELEAIQAWIVAACRDRSLLEQAVDQHDDLELDAQLIRHTRIDTIEKRFIASMWSQFERCANCHSPDRNQKRQQEFEKSISWIVPGNPLRTLELLTERKLIDLDDPENSLMRTKPTGIEPHEAGMKFPQGGQTDSSWTNFLRDYANTLHGRYASSDQLPSTGYSHRWRSGLHLRISDMPEAWYGKIVVVSVYRVDHDARPAERPSAAGEAFVSTDRPYWSNSLELLGDADATTLNEATEPIAVSDVMPAGRYELRLGLGDAKPSMAIEIDAPWEPGHSATRRVTCEDMSPLPSGGPSN